MLVLLFLLCRMSVSSALVVMSVSLCRTAMLVLFLPSMPNEVVLGDGGRGSALVPLLACPKSVEKTVAMDLRGLFANCSGSLLLAPRDAHKRVAEFTNRSFHPNDKFVGRHLAETVLMGWCRSTRGTRSWRILV